MAKSPHSAGSEKKIRMGCGVTATVRRMAASEIERIGEIDRSEHITQEYTARNGILKLRDVDIQAPRWGESGEHSVQYYIDHWKPLVEAGGVLLGAFDGGSLAGFAIYEPPSSDGLANLAVLHVSRTYRGRGVGRDLTQEVIRLAQADRADRLYVSATPTRTTVDFYMRQGFEPLVTPNAKFFALEPDDIHLERKL
jgi:ribosomal protein S18 acetylase RimI-like enzyme